MGNEFKVRIYDDQYTNVTLIFMTSCVLLFLIRETESPYSTSSSLPAAAADATPFLFARQSTLIYLSAPSTCILPVYSVS